MDFKQRNKDFRKKIDRLRIDQLDKVIANQQTALEALRMESIFGFLQEKKDKQEIEKCKLKELEQRRVEQILSDDDNRYINRKL
jgi:hypothetical protein